MDKGVKDTVVKDEGVSKKPVKDKEAWATGTFVSKEHLQEVRKFSFRPTDIILASYPKCGKYITLKKSNFDTSHVYYF